MKIIGFAHLDAHGILQISNWECASQTKVWAAPYHAPPTGESPLQMTKNCAWPRALFSYQIPSSTASHVYYSLDMYTWIRNWTVHLTISFGPEFSGYGNMQWAKAFVGGQFLFKFSNGAVLQALTQITN